MDMSCIMDSGQNRLYTTFPNIFSLLSDDPEKKKKKSFFQKHDDFLIENLLKG